MINDIEYHQSLGKSDHLVLIFDFICEKEIKENITPKFDFNKAEFHTINNVIRSTEWTEGEDVGIQMFWEGFAYKLSNILETHVPRKNIKTRHKNPYIDSGTAKAIKEERTKWLNYKHCKNHITYNNYKIARNKMGNQLKMQIQI